MLVNVAKAGSHKIIEMMPESGGGSARMPDEEAGGWESSGGPFIREIYPGVAYDLLFYK